MSGNSYHSPEHRPPTSSRTAYCETFQKTSGAASDGQKPVKTVSPREDTGSGPYYRRDPQAFPYPSAYPHSEHAIYSPFQPGPKSSFDSTGGASTRPVPVQSSTCVPNGIGVPYVYVPGPPRMSYPYPYEVSSAWMAPSYDYIIDIQPEDVLSGRGGATNSHSGNKEFRKLVKSFQAEYLKAKKRDKPAVASKVVDQVRQKGGRFLKKQGTDLDGRVLWIEIGDISAREKTCQALRENAPEIRRQKASSSDESDPKLRSPSDSSNTEIETPTHSPSSRTSKTEKSPGSDSNEVVAPIQNGDWPIVIRPSARFLLESRVVPMPVDELPSEEREIYLRDFLPPDPVIDKRNSEFVYSEYADTHTNSYPYCIPTSWPTA